MPTSPTPPLPSNSAVVTAKTQRVNIQSADKTELERVQRNLGDRIDELLRLCNRAFSMAPGTKTSGVAAVQSGSSQQVSGSTLAVGHLPIASALQSFWAAASVNGSVTATGVLYGPAGATPTPTLINARVRPPWSGSVQALTVQIYNAVPAAGTYTLNLINQTQGNRITPLVSNIGYGSTNQNVQFAVGQIQFNAFDNLLLQMVTNSWSQNTVGGIEARLYLQT